MCFLGRGADHARAADIDVGPGHFGSHPGFRDGLLKGCNVEATVALARATDIPVIASGGVADIADIHALKPCAADGVEGVITGRALYDGRLDLAEALKVAAQ